VAGLYLELCELSGFLTGQERNQSFKLGCRLVGAISLSEHQMFKFPDCLIVIHILLLIKVAEDAKCDPAVYPWSTTISHSAAPRRVLDVETAAVQRFWYGWKM
jgi:hypothetical protein